MKSRYGCLNAACTLALLMTPASGLGATFRVPSQFPTIQAALIACTVGDTVLVAPGLYEERVTIYDNDVVLMSEEGPDVTTIDAGGLYTVVFTPVTVEGVTIQGFRITNGYYGGGWLAGGIHIDVDIDRGGRAKIRNNIVEYNEAFGGAAGIFAGIQSTVEDNLIQYNENADAAALQGDGFFRRNVIRYNGLNCNSLFIVDVGAFEFSGNIIVGNGIVNNTAVQIRGGLIRNNTIVHEVPLPRSIALGFTTYKPCEFTGNIVVYDLEYGVDCQMFQAIPVIGCNNVWGNGQDWRGDCAGQGGINGNFSADPLFCDPAGLDFHLRPDSPCLPANSPPGCGLIGALGLCESQGVPEAGSTVLRLSVTPNPMRYQAEIAYAATIQNPLLEIYDLQGRVVDIVRPGTPPYLWQPGDAARPGVYFLRLRGEGSSAVSKVVLLPR